MTTTENLSEIRATLQKFQDGYTLEEFHGKSRNHPTLRT